MEGGGSEDGRKANPFEGANLTGICDRLAMEDEGKRSAKDGGGIS